jgi:hypothetical protein
MYTRCTRSRQRRARVACTANEDDTVLVHQFSGQITELAHVCTTGRLAVTHVNHITFVVQRGDQRTHEGSA